MFNQVLNSSGEKLLQLLYQCKAAMGKKNLTSRHYAQHLQLTYAQFSCSLGFNTNIESLPDVVAISGYETYEKLANIRNEYFTNDIYDRLGIRDVLQIYTHVASDPAHQQLMQYLMQLRLQRIESRIEATVNSIVIERYKKEMRTIYNDGVAQIDFAEKRLADTHSGFRALLNEVAMIAESRLIPVGDIFYREGILPEEKRRLIMRGLVPRNLVEDRLLDQSISAQERKVLEEQLRAMR
ncbi:MAG: hypothetical protein AAF387_13915 [Pseudomonadota bacterium]